MKKRIPSIIAIWLLADLYFFQAIKTLTACNSILWGYWLFDIFTAASVFYTIVFRKKTQISPKVISLLMALMLLLLVPKLFALPVLLVEDITRLFRGFPPRITWVSYLALVVAAIPFVSLLFGMTKGRHFYRVCKETLRFKDLPDAFDGFTITQLSDIHAGSFSSEKGVQKGIDLVNAQNSDLILFTGDLVNNQAAEMNPWIPAFAELKATYGKYSVLGNHDYGDYIKWETKDHKYANLNRLKKIHGEIGFKLLLNAAVKIEKDGQSIALIGVENWGKGGFHKYGDLKKAAADIQDDAFKILMSHDPSHWDAVTMDHYQHVHLTLSGHTHGMQFGIELFGFKWSPVKYIYKQWAGLYQKNDKYLYINRGFGFLGFRGRLGIWPEITVITLKKINP